RVMADAGARVSVVVPVRNRRALLRQLLDALAAQTYRDYEVIVVDDGSTDGARDEVAADAAAGRNARLVSNTGSGAVAGRCAGVARSTAEYLAFTDSDCFPHPGWLAAGVAALAGPARRPWRLRAERRRGARRVPDRRGRHGEPHGADGHLSRPRAGGA